VGFFWAPLGKGKGHSKLKNKMTGLGVVGWFLGGQKGTRAGQVFVCDFFYRVFELPSPRNAQERDKTKLRKKPEFLSIFL
jgi:hypothetical protein